MSEQEQGAGTGGGRSFDDCLEVSAFCPVEATVLGYYPNLGSGIFFTVAFGSVLIAAFTLMVMKRTWSYGGFICAGVALEMAGYIGRILLYDNPWNSDAFQLQICAIIIGPTFICVSMYLTLKHVAIHLSPELSRIRPKWYPIIFLPADLTCLIVQAIGGGLAAAAGAENPDLLDGGNNAIIAGIALQVVVLIFFGITATDYYLRVSKYFKGSSADPAALALWNDGKFRKFIYGVTGAYVTILIRCIYRIVEMQGGWRSEIMQDEISFLILDPTLMFVASFLLTAFHPGIFFPQMSNANRAATSEKSATQTPNNETGDSSNEGVKA